MELSRNKSFYILLVCLCIVLPLLFVPELANPYEFPKYIFFVTCIEIFAVFHLIKTFFSSEHKILSRDLMVICVLFFGVITFIADSLGLDPKVSFLGSMYRYQGYILLVSCLILFYLVKYTPPNKETKQKILYSLPKITTICICIVALYQTLMLFLFHNTSIPNFQGRIIATFGNPNFLAGYLSMLIPLILATFSTTRLKKTITVSILTASAFVIYLTDSRSSFLALGVLFIFYLLQLYKKKQVSMQKNITILLGVALIFLLVYLAKNIVFTRISVWDNRDIIWREAIQAIKNRPLLGYGQENFDLIFPPERHIHIDNAHNIFLEVTLSSGLLGLGIFITILFLGFKQAPLPIRLSLMVFLITAQFNPLSLPQIVLFWLLLGIT